MPNSPRHQAIIKRCSGLAPMRTAVVYPVQHTVFEAIDEAVEAGLIEAGIVLGARVPVMLTSRADSVPEAQFSLDYFALKCAQAAAALVVALGGIDAFVFTGGIGENAEPIRRKILEHLKPLGSFQHLVIPANEERMMAMEAVSLLEARP